MNTKLYPLVGRSETLGNLSRALFQGWSNQGEIIFIEGEAGMGKTILLQMLQEQIRQFPELATTTFTYGYCYANTGSQNAYQPFVEILETLSRADKDRKDIAKLMFAFVKETAPDWLLVVPMLGPALSAGVKSTYVVKQWLFDMNAGKQLSQSNIMISQYINMLIKISSQRNPLVIVIEDAHW